MVTRRFHSLIIEYKLFDNYLWNRPNRRNNISSFWIMLDKDQINRQKDTICQVQKPQNDVGYEYQTITVKVL